jgi:hypothetical protein
MESKKWYTSKTVWVSLIIFFGSILSALNVINLDLSPDAAWVGIAWSVIQMGLRLITKQPVSAKPGDAVNLLPLLLLFLLAGCSGAKSETLMKEQKVTLTSDPIVAVDIPAEYKNMPEAEVLELETIYNKLPDSAVITAHAVTKTGRVEGTYNPKKKHSAFWLFQSPGTQPLSRRYQNLLPQKCLG